jgi:exonuclease III
MKIISWNCNYDYNTFEGLTSEKYKKIIEYKPDILIIHECTKNEFDKIKRDWEFRNWYCDDIEDSVLGVAIVSNDYKIQFTNHFNRSFRYIIPYNITGHNFDHTIFVVWTKEVPYYYYESIFSAIDSHEYDNLLEENSIMIGDFNTGLIQGFNEETNETQIEHNKLYKKLLDKLSMLKNCTLGTNDEYKITYSHNNTNFYLNDFCFVSKNISSHIKKITIPSELNNWIKKGEKYYWNGLSDHCPIILEWFL